MRIPDGSDQSADISREFFRAGDHLDLMADGRNIKDVELIYEAHHPDFFIFDAFQHLWLEDTTPHFRHEVDLLEPFDCEASSLKKEVAASQSMKASSAMLRPVTSVTRFKVQDDVLFESRISRRCARSSRPWTLDSDRRRPRHGSLCRRSCGGHGAPGSQECNPRRTLHRRG